MTVVTQNIDRLHHKAGSQDVLELHGEGGKCQGSGIKGHKRRWGSVLITALTPGSLTFDEQNQGGKGHKRPLGPNFAHRGVSIQSSFLPFQVRRGPVVRG